MAHACNPSTLGGRDRRISESEANLVYRVSSRTARATQQNKNKNKQTKLRSMCVECADDYKRGVNVSVCGCVQAHVVVHLCPCVP